MTDPEFYVGYQPRAHRGLRRTLRIAATGLCLLSIALAGLLVIGQSPFAASRFDFLNYRLYRGIIYEWPYPMLIVDGRPYLLVAAGKHGADSAVRGLEGRSVELRGELIERGENRMLEIEAGSVRADPSLASHTRAMSLGRFRLAGEIVDTKCHFGVMNPGQGKVHRDCAARCISGGVPPGFLVRDADGASRVLLLVGADSRKLNTEILDYVAEPIHITGELVRSNSTWVLKADPHSFQRD